MNKSKYTPQALKNNFVSSTVTVLSETGFVPRYSCPKMSHEHAKTTKKWLFFVAVKLLIWCQSRFHFLYKGFLFF